jgi:ketosteroid isomerase-like protein
VLDDLIFPQPFIGNSNIKTWFDIWKAAIPDARSEITTILPVANHVLVENVVRGSLKGAFGRLAASNKPLLLHRAAVFETNAGKIARVRSFMNGKELAVAAGQWPMRREHE